MKIYEIRSEEKLRETDFVEKAKRFLPRHEIILNTHAIYYEGEVMNVVGAQINADRVHVAIYSRREDSKIKKKIEKESKNLISLLEVKNNG